MTDMRSNFNEMMPYYGMDPQTAQVFAPIDKYLKLTKRFSPKAMKKKFIKGIILYAAGLFIFLYFTFLGLFQGDAVGICAGLFMMIFDAAMIALLVDHIKHFGEEPDENMLICRTILEKDGIAEISKDYADAVKFTKQSVIGKKYIFVKGVTLIRLSDIKETVLDERKYSVKGSVSFSYHFTVHAEDERGKRAVDLELLSNNEIERKQRYEELRPVIEEKQKRIDMVDI